MKRIKWGTRIVALAMIYWIIYNSYYGWNAEPINDTEAFLDLIYQVAIYIGFLLYLSPLIELYEASVKKHFNQ